MDAVADAINVTVNASTSPNRSKSKEQVGEPQASSEAKQPDTEEGNSSSSLLLGCAIIGAALVAFMAVLLSRWCQCSRADTARAVSLRTEDFELAPNPLAGDWNDDEEIISGPLAAARRSGAVANGGSGSGGATAPGLGRAGGNAPHLGGEPVYYSLATPR